MKKLFLIITLLLFATGNVVGQNPNNHWQLGNSDVNFSTNPPTVTTAGNVNQYGNASISDDNGNLLFYTDGNQVWNKNHQLMANPFNISIGYVLGNLQPVVIVPQFGTNKYYIITVIRDNNLCLPPCFRNFHHYRYSVVDFSINSLGSLTNDSNELTFYDGEGKNGPLTVSKNSTNDGYWIITHTDNSIRCFSLTASGLGQPIVSSFSNSLNIIKDENLVFKISSDNLKLGVLESNPNYTESKFFTYDFDNATGQFSNKILYSILPGTFSAYNFDFSSDSQKVYFTKNNLFVKDLTNSSIPIRFLVNSVSENLEQIQKDKYGDILITTSGGVGSTNIRRILNENSFSSSSLTSVYLTLNTPLKDPNCLPQLIPVLTPPCPNALVISTNVASGLDKKQASVSIEATNVINIGAGAIYHAPTVILKPSFNAKVGSAVHLYTVGCTNTFLARPFNVETSSDNFSKSNKYFQEKANIISVQPNPSNGIFKISLNEVSEGTIEISDLYGFNIYKSEFKNQTDFEMNLQDRPKGIYIVKVFSGEQVFTNKIIKN